MANDYQGFSPTDFARSAATTLAKHITEVEEAFARNFRLLSQIEASGRIMYNQGGRGIDWPVKYRIHNVEGNTGETQRNFARRNLWKVAQLEYRGYQATDAMYMREFLENRGEQGIVKVFDQFVDRLTTSMKQALGTHPYIDGSASGNEQFWHGLESIFATNGTVDTSQSEGATSRSTNTADLFAYPSDTYAALSTVLGNYGGENESGQVWPDGLADPEFDFWSPVIAVADSTNSYYTTSTHDFANQGDETVRLALSECDRNAMVDGQVDTVLMDRAFFRSFKNLLDDKEEIQITPGAENSLKQLGFKDVIGFDGRECSWEAGVPANTAYGYNLNCIEMLCMYGTMWVPDGPEYDIYSQAFNAAVSTLSNFKFKSPRNFFKVANSADIT